MTSLRDLQQEFIGAVIGGANEIAQVARAGRGLAVHRNNWRNNLRGALQVTYPVVVRLVGEEFFDYMANVFIGVTPSRSANLEDYGAGFADFISIFEPAAGLPYLADVARLEFFLEAVLSDPDGPIELASSAGTTQYYGAARLLRSPFPVQRIWQVNQPGHADEANVSLDEGSVLLLVRREALDVLIETLPEDEITTLLEYGDH